jgi:hypothetical protein
MNTEVSQNSMEKLPNFNRINGKVESTIKIIFVLIDMKKLLSLSTVKIISNLHKNNYYMLFIVLKFVGLTPTNIKHTCLEERVKRNILT